MALIGGTWGYARWGGSLWGFKQSGISVRGNALNAEVVDFLSQVEPSQITLSFSCYLGGVEYYDKVVSFRTEAGTNKRTAYCELVFAGTNPGFVSNQTSVVLTITYTIKGISYTGTLFRGKIGKIVPQIGLSSQTLQLICYDNFADLDLAPSVTTWTGETADLFAQEAMIAGVTMLDFDFTSVALTDYTINANTKRILLQNIAGATEEIAFVVQPDGVLTARNVAIQTASGWTFPLSNQISQGLNEDSDTHNNKCTITGSTGETNTYSSAADIAIYGELATTLTSSLPLTAAQCLSKATSFVSHSIKPSFSWQSLINPWLRCGAFVSVYINDYSAYKNVLVEEINTSGSWQGKQGFWAALKGTVMN